ncbi:site-2 protease family protein [Candidatus Micrarchaeota archaeon]|nr:site-2 protease family protein [Candidatus Micrarchaeota archaeon]
MPRFELDTHEIIQILVSVITISIAFAIVWTRSTTFDANFLAVTGIILFTVGLGFVLHELAHKYVAIRYGAAARYHAWTLGLLLAVIMAFAIGIVFAAPGAVYIYGHHVSREQNGKISLAGPATNLLLGLFFVFLGFAFPAIRSVAVLGAQVNFFLGAFNMLPFFPMDGSKVFSWDKRIWALFFFSLVILSFVPLL